VIWKWNVIIKFELDQLGKEEAENRANDKIIKLANDVMTEYQNRRRMKTYDEILLIAEVIFFKFLYHTLRTKVELL
jgi:hypothetical protein